MLVDPDERLRLAATKRANESARCWYILARLVGTRCPVRLSLWCAIALGQFKVHLQDIDHLFAEQTTHRRESIALQDLLDLAVYLRAISLGVRGPLRRNAIELVFSIFHRNVGIEAGARSSNHVGGNIGKVVVRVVLPPHIEKDRLDIRTTGYRRDCGRALPAV